MLNPLPDGRKDHIDAATMLNAEDRFAQPPAPPSAAWVPQLPERGNGR
ncbi:hypothetical protein ABZ297_37145 [Nonomuraea sp. NPDC005983]